MTLSLTCIIPAYNSLAEVTKCLTTLQLYASKQVAIEFLVADDASPDVDFREHLPPCAAKVVRSEVNGGFGLNCNTGAAFAQGDILFFCNQDVWAGHHPIDHDAVSQDWDLALVKAFDDASIGIVGAKLLFPNGAIQNAGGYFDGKAQPSHIGLGYINHRYYEVNTPKVVSWTTGGALGIRRELFSQLGGFDTVYPSYFEDVDLCLRACEAGFKTWFEPRCILFHTVGTSGGSPHFNKSAKTFYDRWVDSKRVQPDTLAVSQNRFW